MSRVHGRRRALRSSKRWTAWTVLVGLLFIHLKVAVAGCLVTGLLAGAAAQDARADAESNREEPCSQPRNAAVRFCLKHCEQSAGTPVSTLELTALGEIALPLPAAIVHVSDSKRVAPGSSLPPASTGPPPYLRFLRLLN